MKDSAYMCIKFYSKNVLVTYYEVNLEIHSYYWSRISIFFLFIFENLKFNKIHKFCIHNLYALKNGFNRGHLLAFIITVLCQFSFLRIIVKLLVMSYEFHMVNSSWEFYNVLLSFFKWWTLKIPHCRKGMCCILRLIYSYASHHFTEFYTVQ